MKKKLGITYTYTKNGNPTAINRSERKKEYQRKYYKMISADPERALRRAKSLLNHYTKKVEELQSLLNQTDSTSEQEPITRKDNDYES